MKGTCPQMGNDCPGELKGEVEGERMDFGKHLQCAQASYWVLYVGLRVYSRAEITVIAALAPHTARIRASPPHPHPTPNARCPDLKAVRKVLGKTGRAREKLGLREGEGNK